MASNTLPPFAGLLAFDAILRLGSFTAAAEALCVTQSAVSHRMRQLERHFGCRLIERLNPGLQATAAGARLLAALEPILAQMAALDPAPDRRLRRRSFRVALGQALLSLWLSPRLPALAAAFPRLDFEISVLTSRAQARRSPADLVLEWQPRADFAAGPNALAFPAETVFPVCRPDLLAHGADWRLLPLIDKGGADAGLQREWQWAHWLGRKPVRKTSARFEDLAGSLQAALDGNGVALARGLLVADALGSGRLARVKSRPSFRASSKLQCARWRPDAASFAAPVALWLAGQAAESLYRPNMIVGPSRVAVQS